MANIDSIRQHYSNCSVLSKSTLQKYKKKKLLSILDKLCSDLVVLRDKHCICCGESREELLTNGHYLRRGKFGTRWDLTNCNCQCRRCNNYHEISENPYRVAMEGKYGLGVVDMLENKAQSHVKYTREDLANIYTDLMAEIKELAKE